MKMEIKEYAENIENEDGIDDDESAEDGEVWIVRRMIYYIYWFLIFNMFLYETEYS